MLKLFVSSHIIKFGFWMPEHMRVGPEMSLM